MKIHTEEEAEQPPHCHDTGEGHWVSSNSGKPEEHSGPEQQLEVVNSHN